MLSRVSAKWSGAVICPALDAVHLTAGPDGVRWSGPYQDYALLGALNYSGLPDPQLDRSPSLPLHPRMLYRLTVSMPAAGKLPLAGNHPPASSLRCVRCLDFRTPG
jgi:hypothetical protein